MAFLLAMAATGTPGQAAEGIRFNRDIRTILTDNCMQCHGPDKSKRKANLRLDIREEAIKAGVIVPGKTEDSPLIARILNTDPAKVMPPPKSNKKLTAEQKNLLKQWVAEGAVYQGHWSYEKPIRAEIPPGTNNVDFLVQKRLTSLGLKLSPQADPRTLIRRLSLDLLGLPPTPEEVDAFVQASSRNPQAAWEHLVDRFLASPHYGERLALTWLDIARFADTCGYHSDNPHNVWPYRDYVIRAFNNNKPFDQFTVEQLAGDLLPGATSEQKVASCFNHLLLTTEEGGAQAKDYEARMVADRVRAVGTVWLGQTFGCCQCHDHKYDPMTQKDFYSLGAFFADIQEPIIGRRDPGMVLADEKQTAEQSRLRKEVETLGKTVKEGPDQAERKKKWEAAKKTLADFEANLPHCMVTTATTSPRTVRLLGRGNWMDDKGPVMQPALPQFLATAKVEGNRRLTRLDLARWIPRQPIDRSCFRQPFVEAVFRHGP
jgi:Protein of unknown function (DUF1549)/Planctomycete cytochrome C